MRTSGTILLAPAILSALAAVAALAAEPAVLTLADAVERALEANHALDRARSEVAVADADVRRAVSLVKPRIDLDARATRNSPEVAIALQDLTATLLPREDWDARLRLRQPLYAGGQEWKAYRQSRIAAGGSRDGLRGAEEDLLLRLVADYLGVARGDALIAVETRSVELATRRLGRAEVFFEAGEVTRVDVLRARAAIAAAERRLASARRLRETAAGRLRIDLALDGVVAVERPERPWPSPPPVAELEARALARPEVARAEKELEIATLEVARRRGARLPEVDAEALWTRQRANFPTDQYASVSLLVSVPLYRGGRVAAEVAIARERERQASQALAELRLVVREGLRQALLDRDDAATQLALARDQLAAVEAEYAEIAAFYEALEATSLDVEVAELALAEARRAGVEAALDRDLAEAGVWHAAGGLKSALREEHEP